MNDEVFAEGYKKLQKGQLNVESFTDTTITGTFKAEKDGLFFTSIPYDKSWEVYVDGKKLDYAEYETEENTRTLVDDDVSGKVFALGNGLVSFGASKGEHSLEMKYKPAGLGIGAKISLLTLLIIALYLIMKRFGIIDKLPIIRKLPKYSKNNLTITNDIFVCGDEPYDKADNISDKMTDNFNKLPVREVITPPSGVINTTQTIILKPEDVITLEKAAENDTTNNN